MKATFEEILERDGRLVYTSVGDSMLPFIHSGEDILVIEKPSGRLKKYDIALYYRDSGEYVLHRVLRVREYDYIICGDNRWRCEKGIADKQIIGVLTAIVRNGKMISMKDPDYYRRVRLWCSLYWCRAPVLWVNDKVKSIIKKLRLWKKDNKE